VIQQILTFESIIESYREIKADISHRIQIVWMK